MLSISCIIPEESHLWSVNDLHEIPWFLPNFYPLGFKKFLHFTTKHTNISQAKPVWNFLLVTCKLSILILSKSKYGKYILISTLCSKYNYNVAVIATIKMNTTHETFNHLKNNLRVYSEMCI